MIITFQSKDGNTELFGMEDGLWSIFKTGLAPIFHNDTPY